MKGLIKIYNRGKFHLYSICVVKLQNLNCFRGDGASMKWPFYGGRGGGWALTPPNMVRCC